uniref:Uncharacterized protein n=1 Tax=Rhizophora mucronata TaxID=61149 RepID=A0A2P2KA55_RHIMU
MLHEKKGFGEHKKLTQSMFPSSYQLELLSPGMSGLFKMKRFGPMFNDLALDLLTSL